MDEQKMESVPAELIEMQLAAVGAVTEAAAAHEGAKREAKFAREALEDAQDRLEEVAGQVAGASKPMPLFEQPVTAN